jgi:heme/copper-type cytochrome/quinol oxidase subunit 1
VKVKFCFCFAITRPTDLSKLELRLTLHSSEAVRHNGLNTELTVTVRSFLNNVAFISITNFCFQVISPVALATAYFSMPQAVIPFKLNTKSFVVAIFVIMASVRLLFAVFGALLRWWKAIRLNRMALSPKTIEKIGWFIIKRGRSYSTDDLETGCWKAED